jgi:hypothetical protein
MKIKKNFLIKSEIILVEMFNYLFERLNGGMKIDHMVKNGIAELVKYIFGLFATIFK